MAPESGRVYHIINAKSGTALDAAESGAINGYQPHGGGNQRWTVENNGSHWTFRNDKGQYLGYNGEVREGLPLTAVNQAVEWDIWPDKNDQSLQRIYVPGWHTAMNIDLSDHGNSNNGTPVTLWGQWEGSHQAWRFEQA
ncbi:hypothetical protein E1B28_007706 [Marasmius oreades]|uniref:Ricin B lectin domain-containing protein n=1 Tax=Marasmius oreades TaxID=181124 RepID=A0A9P7S2W6_9AGAR|nr:uncharacterized protein E1B28_007706 [Marasmius oreades]KAG7094087.1 hypothetical protein E1B28_007706 [Marasmius oreades]